MAGLIDDGAVEPKVARHGECRAVLEPGDAIGHRAQRDLVDARGRRSADGERERADPARGHQLLDRRRDAVRREPTDIHAELRELQRVAADAEVDLSTAAALPRAHSDVAEAHGVGRRRAGQERGRGSLVREKAVEGEGRGFRREWHPCRDRHGGERDEQHERHDGERALHLGAFPFPM